MGVLFIFIMCAYSKVSFANVVLDPQFSDYETNVSSGPFAKKVYFDIEQQSFSKKWKERIQLELNKPVNFDGHYRIYTFSGGYESECPNEAWVCGWVIDKFTGKVVSKLPKDIDGSSIYASVGDNGTPVGYPFEIDFYKDSTMIIVTGQAISLIQALIVVLYVNQ